MTPTKIIVLSLVNRVDTNVVVEVQSKFRQSVLTLGLLLQLLALQWMDYPLTIGTAVVSEDFNNFVNWLESIERLDNTGVRVVPEDSVRIVVYDVGLNEYHRNLLEAGFIGEGRARPLSIVLVRSLKSQLQGIGLGQSEVSLLFATRALILASLLDEFGAISKVSNAALSSHKHRTCRPKKELVNKH